VEIEVAGFGAQVAWAWGSGSSWAEDAVFDVRFDFGFGSSVDAIDVVAGFLSYPDCSRACAPPRAASAW
jgi:hypothetical protein